MDRERSLAGYSPWGHKESDRTERLNNNKKGELIPHTEKAMAPPLQYSCLKNPMDGGAW